MSLTQSTLAFAVAALVTCACGGSKEADANAASSPAANQTTTNASRLASLDAKSALQENWTLEDVVAPMPMLLFAQPVLKLSASCKKPDGALDCAALTYMRNGMPTEIPKRELERGRGGSPGEKVCKRLDNQVVKGNTSLGTTDVFCRFPDGSMVNVGALEQYSLRIIQ
jgi:hypothetical protein